MLLLKLPKIIQTHPFYAIAKTKKKDPIELE